MASGQPNVTVALRGEDEGLESELEKAGSEINTFALNAKNLIDVGRFLLNTFNNLRDAAAELLDLFGEQEEQMVLTAQLLRVTGRGGEEAAQGLYELASAYQATSRFGDEATLSASRYLIVMENISNEMMPRAIRLSQDMAAALGRDLSSSAMLVGRALDDPVRGLTMLTRVGVNFTQQQRDMIKVFVEANRTIDAQEVVLSALEGKFAGSAAAAVDTYRGRVEQLSNTFGDMKEEVGGLVAEALTPLLDSLRDNEEAVSDFTEKVDSNRQAAREWGIILRNIIESLKEIRRLNNENAESDNVFQQGFERQRRALGGNAVSDIRRLLLGAGDSRDFETVDLRGQAARIQEQQRREQADRERAVEAEAIMRERKEAELAEKRRKEREKEREAREKAIEAEMRRLERMAERWRDATRNPFEELIEQVKEVNMLTERGALSPQERIAILRKLRDEFELEGDLLGKRDQGLERQKDLRERLKAVNEELRGGGTFQSQFEGLTSLSRRISLAAASDTPEDKTRQELIKQREDLKEKLDENKDVLEQIREEIKKRIGQSVAVFGRR